MLFRVIFISYLIRYEPTRRRHRSSVPLIFSTSPAYGLDANCCITDTTRSLSFRGSRLSCLATLLGICNSQFMSQFVYCYVVSRCDFFSCLRNFSEVFWSRLECFRGLYFFLPRQKILVIATWHCDEFCTSVYSFWDGDCGHSTHITPRKHASQSSLRPIFQGVFDGFGVGVFELGAGGEAATER